MSFVKQIIVLVTLAGLLNKGDAVLCLRQCGGEILGSDETVGDCCSSPDSPPFGRGGEGYLLVTSAMCSSCFDFQTIPTNITIESTPVEPQLGNNLTIDCVVTFDEEEEIDVVITWFLPNGNPDSTFSISGIISRFTAPLVLSSLTVDNFGTYLCSATVSSDTYPWVNVSVEETFTYTGTSTTPIRVIPDDSPPVLGNTYRLTCITNSSITMINTIEWLSPDGTLLDSQDVSTGMGETARELLFDELSFSNSGRYTCRLNNTISIPVLLTVEAPEVIPVVSGEGQDPFPVLEEMYLIECNVTVPELPNSRLKLAWISPSGDILDEITVINDTTAAVSVLFDSVEPQAAGDEYTCEAILSTSLSSQDFFYSNTFILSPEVDRCRGECDINAECVELLGAALCMCNDGFVGNGITCDEIVEPECRINAECDPNASCLNNTCVCNEGFSGNGTTCVEIIEPECMGDEDCDSNASCLGGSCECDPGFTGNGTFCMEITTQPPPECMGDEDCDSNASCLDGSCECDPGFTGNGTFCMEITTQPPPAECICDEDCDSNATCLDGSCECDPGFTGNGTFCMEITTQPPPEPECMGDEDCDLNATCLDGSCECDPGFTGNGTFCVEIITQPPPTECTSDADCDPNARCLEDGNCRCNNGFEGNGQTCRDINECERNLDNCARKYRFRKANCINTVGGFQCQCLKGFEGNGTSCRDIDECDSDPCHRDADCENLIGTFICRCRKKNVIGDGINCCIKEKTLEKIAKEEIEAGRAKREEDEETPRKMSKSPGKSRETGSGDESPRTPKSPKSQTSGRGKSRETGSGDETPRTPKSPKNRTSGRGKPRENGSGDETPRTPKSPKNRTSGRGDQTPKRGPGGRVFDEDSSGDEQSRKTKTKSKPMTRETTGRVSEEDEGSGSGDEQSRKTKTKKDKTPKGKTKTPKTPKSRSDDDTGSGREMNDDTGRSHRGLRRDDETTPMRGRRSPRKSTKETDNSPEGESSTSRSKSKSKKKGGSRSKSKKKENTKSRKGTKGGTKSKTGRTNANERLQDQYPECEAVIQAYIEFSEYTNRLSYSWPW